VGKTIGEDATVLVLIVPIVLVGLNRFMRWIRRLLRFRMSIARYSFRMVVVYVGGVVSVVSELELSGVPGMSLGNGSIESGRLGDGGAESRTRFIHKYSVGLGMVRESGVSRPGHFQQ
jgi:hypothetical protein